MQGHTTGRAEKKSDTPWLRQELLACQATITKLRKQLAHYDTVVDNTPDLILTLSPQGTFLFANRAWGDRLGYSLEDLSQLTLLDIIDAPHRDGYRDILMRLFQGELWDHSETVFTAKDGRKIPVEGHCSSIMQNNKTVAITGTFRDITVRRKSEDALRRTQKHLESQVAAHSQELKEANIALNIVLKRYEQNRNNLEQQILKSLAEKVTPLLDRLKKSGLRDSQRNYLTLIETGIKEMLSPSVSNNDMTFNKLTSTEKTVASLVMRKKTTKEIATLLDISPGTVSKHRENIRKKIGVTHSKKSLAKAFGFPT